MKVGNVNEVKIFLLQLRNLQNVNVKLMPIKYSRNFVTSKITSKMGQKEH